MARKVASLPPVHAWQIVPPIMGAEGIMAVLGCGRSKLDDLIRDGMPAINIGQELRTGKKGRTRRSLRFEADKVICWLRERDRNGGGGL